MRRLVIVAALLAGLMLPSPAETQTATLPPPDRIAVVGDSLTRGLSATSEQAAFSNIVAERLGAELGRYGVGGIEQAEAVANKVIHWRPQIIILQVGINDTSRMSAEEWGVRYEALVDKFERYRIRVFTTTLFVVAQDTSSERHALLLALTEQVRLIDHNVIEIWPLTLNCGQCMSRREDWSPFKPHWRGDGFHPGDYGHRVMADAIVDGILSDKTYLPSTYSPLQERSEDCHVR